MGWEMAAMAGLGALGGYFGGQASDSASRRQTQLTREQMAMEEARRKRAYQGLSGYNYGAYSDGGQGAGVLSEYLSGRLSKAQQSALDRQREIGLSGISTRAASSGMPSGGRAALDVQLQRDLALGAGQMSQQNQQYGLQASMQDWLAKQQAQLQKAQLMAQYAPGA